MKIFIKKHYILLEILFILVFGLIPLLWYKPGFIAFGHDMGFPLAPVDNFLDRLYTWTDRLGPFGSNSVQVLPSLFIHGLEALLSSLGFSLLTVQKLTYMFWFVLPGVTMYVLLRFLHPKKEDFTIRLSGSLFYMMNHFLLQAWTIAERTKFSIVAAIPLVVLFVIKVFHKRASPVKYAILAALTLFFLNGGEGIPLLLTLFLVLAVTTLIFSYFSGEKFFFKIKRLLVFYLTFALLWILLNSYWLYPYLQSYQQTFGQRFEEAWGTAGAVSWSQSISANASWLNLLRLRGITDWYTNLDHPYANEFFNNPLLIFLNFLLVALALVSLAKIKKLKGLLLKTRIYFLILLLIAIPLAAGSHPPLGIVYDYLLVNMPGFTLFRSGFFKFGMILWFAYAYLIAVGVADIIYWLTRKFKPAVYKEKIPLILLSLYVVSLFIYNYPFFTGSFFNYSEGKSTMVKVPDYIFDAKKELDSNNFSTRTLYLPNADIRTKYIEYDWRYFSLVELPQSMGRKSSVFNGVASRSNEVNLIVSALSEYKRFGYSNLVKFTGVDRAVVQNDFISPDYEGNPLSGVVDEFIKSDDFTFDKSIGRWDFYNYEKVTLPRIYSPSAITFISSTPKNLDIAANMPGVLDEAFVWSDFLEDSKREGVFDKLVIQARCGDCPGTSYNIFFSTSKVMIPGTVFYNVGKLVTELKKNLAPSPEARINIILSSSAILISDLGSIQAKKKEKGVEIAVEDLTKNLDEIERDLQRISDPKVKKELTKKIRFFLSKFSSYESQWAAAAVPGPIKSELLDLEIELKESIAEVEIDNNKTQTKNDGESSKYFLEIPQDGDYDLYLFAPSYVVDFIPVNVNEKLVDAKKLDVNWYKASKITLRSSSTPIEIQILRDPSSTSAIFARLPVNSSGFVAPNIEFVALNQTKYLIKTSRSEQFILGFNSRFDPNWSLREINQDTGSYFEGNTKKYQKKVIEYERNDTHIITDLVFRNYSPRMYPTLELNGFSSGWIVSTQFSDEPHEHVFLLEYNNQNDFYKAFGVSLAALVLTFSFYSLKYGKSKN